MQAKEIAGKIVNVMVTGAEIEKAILDLVKEKSGGQLIKHTFTWPGGKAPKSVSIEMFVTGGRVLAEPAAAPAATDHKAL